MLLEIWLFCSWGNVNTFIKSLNFINLQKPINNCKGKLFAQWDTVGRQLFTRKDIIILYIYNLEYFIYLEIEIKEIGYSLCNHNFHNTDSSVVSKIAAQFTLYNVLGVIELEIVLDGYKKQYFLSSRYYFDWQITTY